ncbi:hypothetical protein PHDIMM138B_07260 [Phytobacter diazotrophicus]
MKDHEIRELVNQLRDIAVEYRDTQQLRERIAHIVRSAIQSGNSAQPEPVNKTYKLPPNSFSDDELMGMAHGDNPVANACRELLEFRRNAAGGNSAQPVTVPDGLRLALSNAGIAAPESDEMLFATHDKYVQLLVNWVKDRKPFAVPAGYAMVPVEPTPEILATITEAIKVMRGSAATYSRVLAAAPKVAHFRENANSSTELFREIGETSTKCWCRTCRPVTMNDMRFVVCPDCGNKRCPKANDHRNACTGSNEPGQPGSAYPDAPKGV